MFINIIGFFFFEKYTMYLVFEHVWKCRQTAKHCKLREKFRINSKIVQALRGLKKRKIHWNNKNLWSMVCVCMCDCVCRRGRKVCRTAPSKPTKELESSKQLQIKSINDTYLNRKRQIIIFQTEKNKIHWLQKRFRCRPCRRPTKIHRRRVEFGIWIIIQVFWPPSRCNEPWKSWPRGMGGEEEVREISDVSDGSPTLKIWRRCSPSTVNEKAAFKSVAVMQCDVKFCDNVVDDSHEWFSTSAKMKVCHDRQSLPPSANEIRRTNLAP